MKPSKWCGGCHDPAMLFSGLMDRPSAEMLTSPESQAGLGCVACHAIVSVDSTMGQGGFTMEYPTLSDLAASEQPVMRFLHDFIVKVNPEPHRRAFLKPFMKEQAADFCSTCHKVHLDVPVNSYRWIRGFNDYDNWQASGVSGMGARSFYYPPKSQRCVDCHMPKVASDDFGNKGGSSRRTASPRPTRRCRRQRRPPISSKVTKLPEGQRSPWTSSPSAPSLAASGRRDGAWRRICRRHSRSAKKRRGDEGPAAAHASRAPITAPLNRVDAAVRRGDTVRVDVVVRTRKVGHFFPGGTVDAFDVWVELQAVDEKGQIIYWSGAVDDGGKGPVEPGAHFYKSLQIDSNGNVINKRNAWSTRSVVYVKLIPPGAADTVHYRLQMPETAGDKITLKAKLNYRKFQWYQHAVRVRRRCPTRGGRRVRQGSRQPHVHLHGDTSTVSGKVKTIPEPADLRRRRTTRLGARAAEDGAGAGAEDGAEAGGLDALERLRHRLPAAGRPEACRGGIHAGHGDRSEEPRRLGEHRPRARAGRQHRPARARCSRRRWRWRRTWRARTTSWRACRKPTASSGARRVPAESHRAVPA